MAKSTVVAKNSSSQAAATRRRKVFVERYLVNGNNATEAAKFAGFSQKTAYSAGQRLLNHPKTKELMGVRAEQVVMDAQLTTDRWAKEMACIGHFDAGELYDPAGNLIPIHLLPEHVRRAISSVEHVHGMTTKPESNGKVTAIPGSTVKVKMCDKNTALANIGKHLGMFERDNHQKAQRIQVLVQLVG